MSLECANLENIMHAHTRDLVCTNMLNIVMSDQTGDLVREKYLCFKYIRVTSLRYPAEACHMNK